MFRFHFQHCLEFILSCFHILTYQRKLAAAASLFFYFIFYRILGIFLGGVMVADLSVSILLRSSFEKNLCGTPGCESWEVEGEKKTFFLSGYPDSKKFIEEENRPRNFVLIPQPSTTHQFKCFPRRIRNDIFRLRESPG